MLEQPKITPSTDRQWMEYYRKKERDAANQLAEILNLYRQDAAFVARKGLHWAFVEVRDELRQRIAGTEPERAK